MKALGKNCEESGIALLIRGNSGDFLASLHAIELAKRTGKILHAVIIGRNGESLADDVDCCDDPMLLAAWVGRAEGLRIRWHTLLDAADDELLGFFRTYRIFCLVVGARSKKAMRRKIRWIDELRGKLLSDARWFSRAFWVLVAEPCDFTMFERVGLQLSSRGGETTRML